MPPPGTRVGLRNFAYILPKALLPLADQNLSRILARYAGPEPGPLLVVLGGMHGNEPAGVRAILRMAAMLGAEPAINPTFRYRGSFVGLAGNLRALRGGYRFLEEDLNRILTPENLVRIEALPVEVRGYEEQEFLELVTTVHALIEQYRPTRLYVLDIHTTTASGGIFTIPAPDPESERLAAELHAPVITGMLEGLDGTTLHYFNTGNWPLPTVAVTFEAGQHQEAESTDRAVAAIVNCMRSIGAVRDQDVEHRHDALLQTYSRGLPPRTHLVYTHHIEPEDRFVMRPGYVNFQPVAAGEELGRDKNGPVRAPFDARILMPLYQQQGNDGFFLVKA